MKMSDDEALAILLLKRMLKEGNPKTVDFLEWIYARLEAAHNENPLMDYMQTFKDRIRSLREIERLLL